MEGMQTIDDNEIQEKVESLAGKGVKVIDCEKSSSFQAEEVLLVNGYPVPLQGEEGRRIKTALITGQIPPCELLNEILLRAGILKNPVELETTLNVKSTTKTTELVTLRDKDGVLVDERMKEVEEDNEFNSSSKEVWKKEDKDDKSLLGLGKQLERLTFPSSRRSGASGGGHSSSSPRSTPTPTHSHASQGTNAGGASPFSSSARFRQSKSASPQPPLNGSLYTNNTAYSSPSPETSYSRSPSMSSYSYSPRFSVSNRKSPPPNVPSIKLQNHSDKSVKISNTYASNNDLSFYESQSRSHSPSPVRSVHASSPSRLAHSPSPVRSVHSPSPSRSTHSPSPIRSVHSPSHNRIVLSSSPTRSIHSPPKSPIPRINMSPTTYRKLNESSKLQEIRSTSPKLPKKFIAPTLASLHLELDGIPIRVTYETFV